MYGIVPRDFQELAPDGSNYLEWALDAEIHLAAKDLSETIISRSKCTNAQKAQATAYLRHHLNEDLKRFLTEKDPFVIWQFLKDSFDGPMQKGIILSEAQNAWLDLHFSHFENVLAYNSALLRIASRLKHCGKDVTEEDLIEKTLSTFHPRNLQLHREYRSANYDKYYDLLSAMEVHEHLNLLLMKNH